MLAMFEERLLFSILGAGNVTAGPREVGENVVAELHSAISILFLAGMCLLKEENADDYTATDANRTEEIWEQVW